MVLKSIVGLAQVRQFEGNQTTGIFKGIEVSFAAWVLRPLLRPEVFMELRGCGATAYTISLPSIKLRYSGAQT